MLRNTTPNFQPYPQFHADVEKDAELPKTTLSSSLHDFQTLQSSRNNISRHSTLSHLSQPSPSLGSLPPFSPSHILPSPHPTSPRINPSPRQSSFIEDESSSENEVDIVTRQLIGAIDDYARVGVPDDDSGPVFVLGERYNQIRYFVEEMLKTGEGKEYLMGYFNLLYTSTTVQEKILDDVMGYTVASFGDESESPESQFPNMRTVHDRRINEWETR